MRMVCSDLINFFYFIISKISKYFFGRQGETYKFWVYLLSKSKLIGFHFESEAEEIPHYLLQNEQKNKTKLFGVGVEIMAFVLKNKV